MTTPHHILRQVFGYREFRTHQLDIIRALLDGQDTFVLMPTGSGKSICYQIPSILRPGVGLVVSPLIALMQDQVGALRQNGVRADFLNSSLSPEEGAQVRRRLSDGATDLLYVAPERLLAEGFQQFLGALPLALFAIDEAHCVSQWGHDFRPEYLQIKTVTDRFKGVPRIALTATADRVTRAEIVEKLGLGHARQFVSSFDRPNIRYQVRLKERGKSQLLNFVRKEHAVHSGIVYCRTRNRTDETARWLSEQGLDAVAYHAGLDPGLRARRQRQFLEGEGTVVVATIAFGMGIDKPDVRFVAHLDLPMSMEAYYQETGRAGRDGEPADAWMAYSMADLVALRQILNRSEGDERFKFIQQRKLEALLGYCESSVCRRQLLLAYFGETLAAPCGNCDVCLEGVEVWDGTVAAQKALSCVYRTGQRFGAAYLSDVLVGKDTDRVKRFGHQRLKTFGVGQDLSLNEWRSVYRQLIASGFLSVDMERNAGFRLAQKSWEVLKGERVVSFRKDPRPGAGKKITTSARRAAPDTAGVDSGPLWEALRSLRLAIARESGVPPFVIFHDKTLKEMAALRPACPEELLQVGGVGEAKLERYGEAFLKVIREAGEGWISPRGEESAMTAARKGGGPEKQNPAPTSEQQANLFRRRGKPVCRDGEEAASGFAPPTRAAKSHLPSGNGDEQAPKMGLAHLGEDPEEASETVRPDPVAGSGKNRPSVHPAVKDGQPVQWEPEEKVREFIIAKVRDLGSVRAVAQFYRDDSLVCRYAHRVAKEIFG